MSTLADRGLRSLASLAAEKSHGTRLRYMGGCKCLKCRMANSNYETARAKARRTGDWNGFVSAAPAKAHILKLARAGVGRRMVAQASGVASSSIHAIRRGRKINIRARTARKILGVTAACRGDRSLVSALGLWRRINRLLEKGYTKTALARMLGYSRALQFNRTLVTARNDADVATLYRRLTK